MIICNINTFKLAFKILCLFVTAVMIVYWIAKYLKDEDISVVEFKLVKNMETVFHPEFTICFKNPFIESKFKDISSEISSQKYLQYLKGEIPGGAVYKNIDYDNVTLQLFEHFNNLDIVGNFSNGQKYKNCTNIYKCPFFVMKNNLNAFIGSSQLYKCFGIKPEESFESKLIGINVVFHRELRDLLAKVGNVYTGLNFPGHVLQDYMGNQIWDNLNKTGNSDWFQLTVVELLKRRNKPSQPCSTEWKELDDWILKQHIEDIGCRAPYMNSYKNFPICDTQEKMKQSIFNWPDATYKHPTPCVGASNIGYRFSSISAQPPGIDPASLVISMSYTNKIKTVSQSRLVDGQALIGYIGGYVGLLLGTLKIL